MTWAFGIGIDGDDLQDIPAAIDRLYSDEAINKEQVAPPQQTAAVREAAKTLATKLAIIPDAALIIQGMGHKAMAITAQLDADFLSVAVGWAKKQPLIQEAKPEEKKIILEHGRR